MAVRHRALGGPFANHVATPLSRGAMAYGKGDWNTAAKLARETLALRKDDPAALKLLARASARLGRDDPALSIYDAGSIRRGSRPKIICFWG